MVISLVLNIHISSYSFCKNISHANDLNSRNKVQGSFVQSIVSLTSSLAVKMLTVLVSTISDSQLLLLKNVSSFCKCKRYSHFFNKNISIYAIFNYQSFNGMLTNDIVSFEQLGPYYFLQGYWHHKLRLR